MQWFELSRAKREAVIEVTAEPQETKTMGLAPWQAWFGTICASSRERKSIFVQPLARAVFMEKAHMWHVCSLIPCCCSLLGQLNT